MCAASRARPQRLPLALLLCLQCGYALGSAIPAPALLKDLTVVSTISPSATSDVSIWATEPPAPERPPDPATDVSSADGSTPSAESQSPETSTSEAPATQADIAVPLTTWSTAANDDQVTSETITPETTTSVAGTVEPNTTAAAASTPAAERSTARWSPAPHRRPLDFTADWAPFLGPDEECRPGQIFRVECNFCICPVSGWRRGAQCSARVCPTLTPPGRRRRYRRAPGNGERCAPNIRYMDDCNLCICSADGIKAHSSCTFTQCPHKPR